MTDRPNIVWFIADDTSDEMLGYAGGNVLTPNIDAIARNGIVCTQYHTAAPTCCPSRYAYLTGEAYQALTEVTRADDRIYHTYWYKQDAY